ncbi:MAG TPA: hypothetical protein VNU71_17745 [Burkholderiaceae bacterium]|nr:hypothetical protein [Burkholderiaceae bacterium]
MLLGLTPQSTELDARLALIFAVEAIQTSSPGSKPLANAACTEDPAWNRVAALPGCRPGD